MILTCHFIDRPKVALMVADITDDAVAIVNYKKEVIRIPRYFVSTPVMTCDKCGQPVLLLKQKHNITEDVIECPDHARHMYEALYVASHDMKQYNRTQRRKFHDEAGKWLSKWQTIFKERTDFKENLNVIIGKRLSEVRKELKLTSKNVALDLGFKNKQELLMMEAGTRPVKVNELSKLAELYQKPISHFIPIQKELKETG